MAGIFTEDDDKVERIETLERVNETALMELKTLRKRNAELESQLEEAAKAIHEFQETHIMQMAAISTALLCNTEASLKEHLIDYENPYWSVPYGDAVQAVLREIRWRDKAKNLASAIQFVLETTGNDKYALKRALEVYNE